MLGKRYPLRFGLYATIFLLSACSIFDSQRQSALVLQRTATENLLSVIDSSQRAQTSLQTSPDGRHVMYISPAGKKESVVVDGKKEETFDSIPSFLYFSPNSKRIAYVAEPSFLKSVVVVDGKTGSQYDSVAPPSFSPNSKRLAYVAKNYGQSAKVVVDGNESTPYESVDTLSLVYSPDSQHIAYAASEHNKWFVVREGKEEEPYTKLGNYLHFSPDSQHLAYSASIDDQWSVIIDGKREGRYDQRIDFILFSPDSQHYAYIAHSGNRAFVVLDGKTQTPYNGVGPFPIFSADSQHLVYTAGEDFGSLGAKSFLVVDGKEGKPYNGIRLLGLSQNADRFIYEARLGDKVIETYTPPPTPQGQHTPIPAVPMIPINVVVVDGKELGPYHLMEIGNLGTANISDLRIINFANLLSLYAVIPVSPDGKRFAFAAREDYVKLQPQFMVLDGVEDKRYDEIIFFSSLFSPDSKHFVYAARRGNQQFIVLNGLEGKPYDRILRGSTVFSPDSRHVVYVAQSERYQFVVVDNIEGNSYDEIYVAEHRTGGFIDTRKKIIFDSTDTFHYLARRGNEIYLVEERIKLSPAHLIPTPTRAPYP